MDSSEPANLEQLVDSWLRFDEAGKQLGVSKNKVRQWVSERALIALCTPSSREPRVPAACIDNGQIVKGLGGTLVLLSDSGFNDEEAAVWMFTADESLPGRPIDALRENRQGEVRRRAQSLAF